MAASRAPLQAMRNVVSDFMAKYEYSLTSSRTKGSPWPPHAKWKTKQAKPFDRTIALMCIEKSLAAIPKAAWIAGVSAADAAKLSQHSVRAAITSSA